TVGTEPAAFSVATAPDASELGSIRDKAVLSISPEDLGVITSRWRDHGLRDDAYWRSDLRVILQVGGVIAVLLVLALRWNARLRRQIKQRQRAER
ncbi:hypothetical protein, partial [Pseudomonas sp. BJa3]|uniref:hypothetical protein n=1 Tax=Pseudomonas sp. BJa3 TaxID=2986525 RepID=UPI002265C13E